MAALGALNGIPSGSAARASLVRAKDGPDVVAACRALGMSSAGVAQELARAGFALSSPATLKRRAPRRERKSRTSEGFLRSLTRRR